MADQQQQQPEFKPSPDFLARQKRIDDAVNLSTPDRVPVVPIVVMFYPTKVKGLSNKTAMYDRASALRTWKEVTLENNWDGAPPPGSVVAGRPLEIMGMKQLKWPGGPLSADQPFQWVEGEYMMQSEYDEVLADPNGFAVKTLWPRISTTLAAVSELAQLPPLPLLFLSESYSLPSVFGEMVSSPKMRDLLRKGLELADAYSQAKEAGIRYSMEMMNLGFPLMWGSVTFTAFDCISDYYRGMKGSMLDMYQVPDKLLALIDMFTPLTIGSAAMMARQSGNRNVFIPMHRGAAGFMSDKQFLKFYWPSFKALILGLIDAGLTPIPVFEGDYNPRLQYLAELPPKKVIGHFDVIDRRKAKEMLGDVMCFWGNVPGSLLCTGTPSQVKDNVKELIDIFGRRGLIVDTGLGIPDEAKPENVAALTEAVMKYGVPA
jgi:hypothetical protein